jgi:molybdate transport system substrate-binding protein
MTTVKFAGGGRVVSTYPIALLTSAPEADLAQMFVDLVAGEAGQRVLTQAGFGRP